MLISVKRFYISTGVQAEILLNTDYVQTMEPYDDGHTTIKTKVVYEHLSEGGRKAGIMYLEDSISGIKQKIGLTRNRGAKRGTKRTPK